MRYLTDTVDIDISRHHAAIDKYLMAIIHVSMKSNRLAAYYASQSYQLIQSATATSELDQACTRYRLVKNSMPAVGHRHGEPVVVDIAYLLAVTLMSVSLLDDALPVILDGIRHSRLAASMDVFDKLADVCKAKLTAAQRRIPVMERRQYRMQPGGMAVMDIGNRRDYARYQNRDDSTAVRCLVGKNKWLDVDQIRNEISFIRAPVVRSQSYATKLHASKSFEGDGLATKLARYRIPDNNGSRKINSIKPKSIDFIDRNESKIENSMWHPTEKDQMKSMIMADVSEQDVADLLSDKQLMASDITVIDKQMQFKRVMKESEIHLAKTEAEDFGFKTNFMLGQKTPQKDTTQQIYRSVGISGIPEYKNNTSLKL